MKKLAFLAASVIMLTAFTSETGYKTGDIARDFNLKNVNDSMVSFSKYKDAKGFIVVFTCNHCPFAVKYEDRIIALNNKYQAKGYPVIAINPNDGSQYPDDNFDNMKVRSAEKHFTFPYLHDETQEIAKTYGATRTPHVYVLQKSTAGMVVKYIGAIDDNADNAAAVTQKYVESAVDALLAGKAVAPDYTKAIGCGIKWKK